MRKTNVKEIILVNEDGSTDNVESGTVIMVNGNKVSVRVVNMNSSEIINAAIGLIDAIADIGLGDVMSKAVEFRYGDDVDAGLQDNN